MTQQMKPTVDLDINQVKTGETPIDVSDKKDSAVTATADSLSTDLAADKTRLAQLELSLEQESDKNTALAKSKKREIDGLRSKINHQERAALKQKQNVAEQKVGEKFEFQHRDGSIASKRPCYIRNNRMINNKRVDEFVQLIRRKEYQSVYPIIVANARQFKENNAYVEIIDAYGNNIPDADLDDYYVIIDGQHRSRAIILCKLLNDYEGPIPGVVVKDDIVDIAKYLVSINPSGSWSNNQKAEVLSLTATPKYRRLCEAITALVRKGYNRSTASQIMTQSKPLTTRQIDLLLSGNEPKDNIDYNIENGNSFIDSCTKVGIGVKYLTKRYFIEGFLSFKMQHDITFAESIDVVNKLPQMDEKQLKSVNSKDVFKKMLDEVYSKE